MRPGSRIPTLIVALALVPVAAAGAEPAAIIEEVVGPVAGVAVMDYVAAGTEIRVGPTNSVTIDYLRSCIREVVSGGTLVVGIDESQVRNSVVSRQHVECDGGRTRLSADQAARSGIVAFRGHPMARRPMP